MFKPHPMKKVLIAGSRDLLDKTTDSLFRLRNLHLVDFRDEDPDFKIGTPMSEASLASENLMKLRNATKVLDIKDDDVKEFTEPTRRMGSENVEKGMNDLIAEIDDKILKKWEERNRYENQIRDLDRRIEDLEPFAELPLKIEDLGPYDSLAVFLGTVKGNPQGALQGFTREFEIFSTNTREGLLIALFIEKSMKEQAAKVLFDLNFTEVRAPEGTGYVKDRIAEVTGEKAALLKKMDFVNEELQELRKRHAQVLLASEEHLRIKVEKAEAPMRFATSANSFVIEGFVPERGEERLRKHLQEVTGNQLYIEFTDPEKDEDIPVAMNNPRGAGALGPKNFEVLTDLISRPNYKEIDPTVLMFIGLPIMFGIMLGDIGYGLVMILCWWARIFKKMFRFLGMTGATNQLNNILLWCGVSSLIFGFLFNELFGFELLVHSRLHHGVMTLLPINYPEFTIPRILMFGPTHFPVIRFDNIIPLLKTCVWIGLGHVFIGNAIGFRNMYYAHGFKHALYEKGSWLFIIIGGIMLFYFLLRDMTGFVQLDIAGPIMMMGFVLLIVGCVLLIAGEGPIGLVHLPSVISNSMSYARILAIGLSSAGIALAFNNMGIMAFDAGGVGNLIFGWVILFFGHFINTLLGILGPGLHSLRLHYVEFYVKFYEGGGTPYNPFGILRRFTSG